MIFLLYVFKHLLGVLVKGVTHNQHITVVLTIYREMLQSL